MPREFEDKPGVRSQVPLIIGACGASSSGKTMSMLRLVTGMREVTGGEVFGIDSEASRMCHYADRFKFRHIDFKAPFHPLDYLEAVRYCVSKGATNVIIDSVSHMWEGPGGILETHESECERLMKAWNKGRDVVQMSAWQRPKQDLRRFINEILQLRINLLFCYRAKEKLKIVTGRPPVSLGWRPIAPEELMYDSTINFLLYPNGKGVPVWKPGEPGENEVIKLPLQFKGLFDSNRALDEEHGRQMATWAKGGDILDIDKAMLEGASAASRGSESLKAWFTPLPIPLKKALEQIKNDVWKPLAAKADKAPPGTSLPPPPDGDGEPDIAPGDARPLEGGQFHDDEPEPLTRGGQPSPMVLSPASPFPLTEATSDHNPRAR